MPKIDHNHSSWHDRFFFFSQGIGIEESAFRPVLLFPLNDVLKVLCSRSHWCCALDLYNFIQKPVVTRETWWEVSLNKGGEFVSQYICTLLHVLENMTFCRCSPKTCSEVCWASRPGGLASRCSRRLHSACSTRRTLPTVSDLIPELPCL